MPSVNFVHSLNQFIVGSRLAHKRKLDQPLIFKEGVDDLDAIPEGHEGESEEEAEGAPEPGHQGGQGVDQQLLLHKGFLGHRPEANEEVLGVHSNRLVIPDEAVSLVGAWLQASRHVFNLFHFYYPKFSVCLFIITREKKGLSHFFLLSLPELVQTDTNPMTPTAH